MPDHRTRKGRRFPLVALMMISLAAMLSGANDLRAIFRWERRLSSKALQELGGDPKRRKAPCHATDYSVFRSNSSDNLKAALGVLVKVEGGLGPVALDGKRLQGTSPGFTCLPCLLHAAASCRWRLGGAAGQQRDDPNSRTDQDFAGRVSACRSQRFRVAKVA